MDFINKYQRGEIYDSWIANPVSPVRLWIAPPKILNKIKKLTKPCAVRVFSIPRSSGADGTLWTWGANENGQLGCGDKTVSLTPKQGGSVTNWVGVSAGKFHTFAVKSDGTLWGWGRTSEAQLVGPAKFDFKNHVCTA